MKVLILNNLYPPYARGGAESAVLVQAQGLRAQGHEVHVVTTAPWHTVATSLLEHVTEEDGITVHRYAPLNIWSYAYLDRLPFWLRFLWHGLDLLEPFGYLLLSKLIRTMQPDVVFTHNLKGMGMRTVRAARKAARHVHVLHDVQLITPSGLIWYGKESAWDVQGRLARAYRYFCQRSMRGVREVEAPSQWIIDFHKSFGFFQNAVCKKTSNTDTLAVSPAPRVAAGTSPARRFLFVGQMEAHKGVAFLLEIWKHYSTDHPDVSLTMVGDGSQRDVRYDHHTIQDRVTFTGRLTKQQLEEVYRAHDVLLVPSLVYENAPNVIAEAHAAGLRVFASRIGGIPEQLVDNDRAVTPGDARAWMQVLAIV